MSFFFANLSPFVTGRPKKKKEKRGVIFHADWMGAVTRSPERGWAGFRVQGWVGRCSKKRVTNLLAIYNTTSEKAFWQQLEPIFRRPLRGLFFNQCHHPSARVNRRVLFGLAGFAPFEMVKTHWRERIAEICLFKCLLELQRKKKRIVVDLCTSTSRRNKSLHYTPGKSI